MEITKHIPQRMCLGCRTRKPKSEFLRIVKIDGKIKIDENQKANARGAYICKDKNCFEKIIKKKSLNRAFKTSIPEDIMQKLKELIYE